MLLKFLDILFEKNHIFDVIDCELSYSKHFLMSISTNIINLNILGRR